MTCYTYHIIFMVKFRKVLDTVMISVNIDSNEPLITNSIITEATEKAPKIISEKYPDLKVESICMINVIQALNK